jgi:hypothetical protein
MALITIIDMSRPEIRALGPDRVALRALVALRVVRLERAVVRHKRLIVRFIVSDTKELSTLLFRDRFSATAL